MISSQLVMHLLLGVYEITPNSIFLITQQNVCPVYRTSGIYFYSFYLE